MLISASEVSFSGDVLPLQLKHHVGTNRGASTVRLFNEALMPVLENNERPDLLKSGNLALLLTRHNFLDRPAVKVVSDSGFLRKQRISNEFSQIGPEPGGRRHWKSLFGTVQDRRWYYVTDRLTQNPFSAVSAYLY